MHLNDRFTRSVYKYLLCFLALIILTFMLLSLPPAAPLIISSPFIYTFNSSGILNEASSMQNSTSPYWWLNSGGEMLIQGGAGETMQGDASLTNLWRGLYAKNNPTDTDNGAHPQNLFRLVTKSVWENVSQEIQVFINKDNFSLSPNHNASNGLLLMSRYASDGQTLYYAGIRVDGTAVIKKKYHGIYYTMAQQKIFPGTYSGTQDNINLIPHNEWISLRSDTKTNPDGSVAVSLYMKLPGQTAWTQLLSALDHGQYAATPPIVGLNYAGLRTDFMDVAFRSFELQKI